MLTLNKNRKIKLNYDNKHTLFLFKHTKPNIKATKKINIGEVINPIIPINCMKRLSASKSLTNGNVAEVPPITVINALAESL